MILDKYLEFDYYKDEEIDQNVCVITPVVTLEDGSIRKNAKMYIINYSKIFGEADIAYATFLGIRKLKEINSNVNSWNYFMYLINENGIEIEEEGVQYLFFKYIDSIEYDFKEYWCVEKIYQNQTESCIVLDFDEWWEILLTNNTQYLKEIWDSSLQLEDRIKEIIL